MYNSLTVSPALFSLLRRLPNEAVLHILRLECLPKTRLEAAELLDSVQFPRATGLTVIEKYRVAFPAYIMEYRRAYAYLTLAESEQLYSAMRADASRAIPLRDAS